MERKLGSITGAGTSALYTAPSALYEMLDVVTVEAQRQAATKRFALGSRVLPRRSGYIKVLPPDDTTRWVGIEPDTVFLWPEQSIVSDGGIVNIELCAWISPDKPLASIQGLDFLFTKNKEFLGDELLLEVRKDDLFEDFADDDWLLFDDGSYGLTIQATGARGCPPPATLAPAIAPGAGQMWINYDLQTGINDGGSIRSDNGFGFTARAVRKWLEELGIGTLFIEPGSPWENGYIESFNGKPRNELLKIEIFDTLLEAQVLIEDWRKHYNHLRPHSALGFKPPAAEAIHPAPNWQRLLPAEVAKCG